MAAAGIGLFVEGDVDESEEIGFAAIVLLVAALNLAAGLLSNRVRLLGWTAFAADLSLLGFLAYVFSHLSN